MAAPKPSRLKEILERPGAKSRVGRAIASLIGVGILSIGVVGCLLIWHIVRRGRLIRERQPPPRDVSLPEPPRPDLPREN